MLPSNVDDPRFRRVDEDARGGRPEPDSGGYRRFAVIEALLEALPLLLEGALRR